MSLHLLILLLLCLAPPTSRASVDLSAITSHSSIVACSSDLYLSACASSDTPPDPIVSSDPFAVVLIRSSSPRPAPTKSNSTSTAPSPPAFLPPGLLPPPPEHPASPPSSFLLPTSPPSLFCFSGFSPHLPPLQSSLLSFLSSHLQLSSAAPSPKSLAEHCRRSIHASSLVLHGLLLVPLPPGASFPLPASSPPSLLSAATSPAARSLSPARMAIYDVGVNGLSRDWTLPGYCAIGNRGPAVRDAIASLVGEGGLSLAGAGREAAVGFAVRVCVEGLRRAFESEGEGADAVGDLREAIVVEKGGCYRIGRAELESLVAAVLVESNTTKA
ncbi:hypothetical protein TeGR_g7197 [Tetraparma gracilis]|uniref:Pectinesterase inhibitor domain-containing protein n=1 Tax=Tetraparma gracilis TaxID=2962635 RepID=A0ABQ6M4E8_9STRA|nr:hypothetical protein TeGR_g7197 [Tetraparma gracilis]